MWICFDSAAVCASSWTQQKHWFCVWSTSWFTGPHLTMFAYSACVLPNLPHDRFVNTMSAALNACWPNVYSVKCSLDKILMSWMWFGWNGSFGIVENTLMPKWQSARVNFPSSGELAGQASERAIHEWKKMHFAEHWVVWARENKPSAFFIPNVRIRTHFCNKEYQQCGKMG